MSPKPKLPKILVIEDDLDVAEMLDSYFRAQGYQVKTVNWGEDGLKSAEADCPDLVILDIRLPDIDGFEVAKRLRVNRSTAAVPILFLTEKRQREDRLRGLEAGGDDYITKPFDIQELRLRVHNALVRADQSPTHNPITDLPEGKLVDDNLAASLNQPNWAILPVKLANIDQFREIFGFITADDALRAAGLQILNVLQEYGSPGDFLGHLSPEIFVIITIPEKINKLDAEISSHASKSLQHFYPTEDLEKQISLDNRLHLKPVQFLGEHLNFKDLSELKTALLNQKPG